MLSPLLVALRETAAESLTRAKARAVTAGATDITFVAAAAAGVVAAPAVLNTLNATTGGTTVFVLTVGDPCARATEETGTAAVTERADGSETLATDAPDGDGLFDPLAVVRAPAGRATFVRVDELAETDSLAADFGRPASPEDDDELESDRPLSA